MTFSFSLHHLTLKDLRDRVQRKIKTTEISLDVDGWINDVISLLIAEVLPESLISDGTDTIVGDGSSRIFDLPEDYHAMLVVSDQNRNYVYDGVSPQEMVEVWEIHPIPTRDANVYTIVGRKGDVAALEPSGEVADSRIKFDSILPATSVYEFTYYKLHHKLVNDTDPVFLPPEFHPVIVDGVMLEADQFRDHDDYERHERKFWQRVGRLRSNQNRYPARRVTMGGSTVRNRPARPVLPSNYPRV